MRTTRLFSMLLMSVVVGATSSIALAQSSVADRYTISAKAGGVNYLEGSVSVERVSGKSGLLLRRDRVEIGDRVTTGSDGKAEILLNPGSYIRLGGNSTFEFGSTDLEDLEIKLESGSAMFEVFAANEFRVTVKTPKGTASLIDTGVYRVDVRSNGTAQVSVTKGRAEVGEGTAILKDGRTGTLGNGAVAVAKFDKDKRDELAEWSKIRSKELGKVTSSLQGKILSNTLLNSFNRGGWGIYDSFGLWIYDIRCACHCFLPFGNGWRSPYGWWYNNGIYWNNLPQIYVPPTARKVSGRTPAAAMTSGGRDGRSGVKADEGSVVKSSRAVRDRFEPPPFTRVTRGNGSGAGKYDADSGFDRGPSTYSSPSYSPPPMPAPAKVSGRGN